MDKLRRQKKNGMKRNKVVNNENMDKREKKKPEKN